MPCSTPTLLSRRLLLLMAVVLGGNARSAPPAENFSLQWRIVAWPPAPVAAIAPGSVTVSTGTNTTTPGDQTTRTTRTEAPPQRLLLRNGGQARIALRRDTANDPPDWVWTPQGPGIASARRRPAWRESLWVQLQWPGGKAPGTLGYRFEQPQPDAGRADATQQLDGELLVPFDQWLVLGHWAGPDGVGQSLEVRVSRLR